MLTLDTNILLYSVARDDEGRGPVARDLIARMAESRSCLTQQVAGEFLNVCNRRSVPAPDALAQLDAWAAVFPIVPTRWTNTLQAALLAERYKLQYWDCVIIAVALSIGAVVLFSEDMQDGFVLEGMRIVDPFRPANKAVVDALI